MNKVYVTTYFNQASGALDAYIRVTQSEIHAILLATREMIENQADYDLGMCDTQLDMDWHDGAFHISLLTENKDELESFMIREVIVEK